MRRWKCVGYNQDVEKNFTVGKIYYEEEDKGIKGDDGFCYNCYSSIDKVMNFLKRYYEFEEVFEKKEEIKMNKFKVGDVVRIIKNVNNHCFKIGDIVEIYEVTNDNARCRRIGENQTCGNNVWFYEMELVKEKKEDFDTKTIRNKSNVYNAYSIGKLGGVPELGDYFLDFKYDENGENK